MQATVLPALANQSHTGKPQQKRRRERWTFQKQKASRETSGLSASLAELTCRATKVQRGRTGWKQNQSKTLQSACKKPSNPRAETTTKWTPSL